MTHPKNNNACYSLSITSRAFSVGTLPCIFDDDVRRSTREEICQQHISICHDFILNQSFSQTKRAFFFLLFLVLPDIVNSHCREKSCFDNQSPLEVFYTSYNKYFVTILLPLLFLFIRSHIVQNKKIMFQYNHIVFTRKTK